MDNERITVLQYIAKSSGSTSATNVKELERTITKIEYLTGYPINDLINKLEHGWTLEPPCKPDTFDNLFTYLGIKEVDV